MNTVVTSKKDILDNSKRLIQQNGWKAINIRSVASECGVSVGSIYNYFSSKSELLCATIQNIWHEIFYEQGKSIDNIIDFMCWIYKRMAYGYQKYPNFFELHSISFMQEDIEEGKKLMYNTWSHIMESMCNIINMDKNIRQDAFNESFTQKDFADILFSFILSSLMRKSFNADTVIEVIKRTVY